MSTLADDQEPIDRPELMPLADVIDHIDAALEKTGDSDALQDAASHLLLQNYARHEQYIRCRLGRFQLVFPLVRTLEIGHRPAITILPNLPAWLLGVSNIRGEIVSVVDLAAFLGISTGRRTTGGRFVLVFNNRLKTGLIVDSIAGLFHLRADDETIEPNPDADSDIGTYVKGIVNRSDETLHILDIDTLLASERLNDFMRD